MTYQDTTIEERFAAFHQDNPQVYQELVKLARTWRGRHPNRKVGIELLFAVCRWQRAMKTIDEAAYKLNNSYRSRYARLIMASEPDLVDLFELRELQTA